MSARRRLRILIIAPLRFPIRPPHAGGLESAVWSEADALRRRGHQVTMIAVRGSDFVDEDGPFAIPPLTWDQTSQPTDSTYPPSYEGVSVPALSRALDAVRADADRYDVVSNHCLHPLPLLRAAELGVPMVTTLHTPVDRGFVDARAVSSGGSTFLSVSEFTRRTWLRAGVPSETLPNGIDPRVWRAGPGGGGLVWFGRIVPEKAPHLAIAVARRAGLPLTIAGRSGDHEYAERFVLPEIGSDVTLVGALPPAELADLVGRAHVAIATPAWAEPFGLVAPEALMCGTPFVGFSLGGVPEIAANTIGMSLVPPNDVEGMAARVDDMRRQSAADPTFRRRIRAGAIRRFSLDQRIEQLEDRFERIRVGAPEVAGLSA